MIPDPADRPLLTVAETLEALDGVVSRSALYESIKRGEIPSRKIGRRVLVPTAELRAWAGLSTHPNGANRTPEPNGSG